MQCFCLFLQKGTLAVIVVCTCIGLIGLVIAAALIIMSRKTNCRRRWSHMINPGCFKSALNKHIDLKSGFYAFVILFWSNSALYRSPAYRFTVLQLQEDDVCVNIESGPSSKRHSLEGPDDSDDVSFVCFCFKHYLIILHCIYSFRPFLFMLS